MRKIFERSAVLPLTAFVLSWSAVTVLFCGCGDADLIPKVTRIYVSDSCGMAPLDVGFVAYVSGGNQFDEPTGANSRLAVSWDFGGMDTRRREVGVSHLCRSPYTVLITVADRDGDTTAETGQCQRSRGLTSNQCRQRAAPTIVRIRWARFYCNAGRSGEL